MKRSGSVPDAIANLFRSVMRLKHDFVIQEQMGFEDIPGWDSIGHMNLVAGIETRFGISLDMEEIVTMDSVKAVEELVARKLHR